MQNRKTNSLRVREQNNLFIVVVLLVVVLIYISVGRLHWQVRNTRPNTKTVIIIIVYDLKTGINKIKKNRWIIKGRFFKDY